MPTSSILKDFYVKDEKAFENLKKVCEEKPVRLRVNKSPSLEKGKRKLAEFDFNNTAPA